MLAAVNFYCQVLIHSARVCCFYSGLEHVFVSGSLSDNNLQIYKKQDQSHFWTFATFISSIRKLTLLSRNGQTYFKNLAVFTLHHFSSMFGHFLTWMKELRVAELVTWYFRVLVSVLPCYAVESYSTVIPEIFAVNAQ